MSRIPIHLYSERGHTILSHKPQSTPNSPRIDGQRVVDGKNGAWLASIVQTFTFHDLEKAKALAQESENSRLFTPSGFSGRNGFARRMPLSESIYVVQPYISYRDERYSEWFKKPQDVGR